MDNQAYIEGYMYKAAAPVAGTAIQNPATLSHAFQALPPAKPTTTDNAIGKSIVPADDKQDLANPAGEPTKLTSTSANTPIKGSNEPKTTKG